MSLSTITLSQARLARVGLERPSRLRSQHSNRSRTAFVCDAQQREHADFAGGFTFCRRRSISTEQRSAVVLEVRSRRRCHAGYRAGAESLSLSLASLLVALSADAATGVQGTVESTAAKLPSPPPASSVLQQSSIDQAVSSVVDVVRVHLVCTGKHLLNRDSLFTVNSLHVTGRR